MMDLKEIKDLNIALSGINSYNDFYDYLKSLSNNKKINIKKNNDKILLILFIEDKSSQQEIEIDLFPVKKDLNLNIKDIYKQLLNIQKNIDDLKNENKQMIKEINILKNENKELKNKIEEKNKEVNESKEVINIDNSLFIEYSDGRNKVNKKVLCEESSNDFTERIKEQLAKTSDTIYEVNNIKGVAPNLFIPISSINQARRELLNELNELRKYQYSRVINDCMPILDIDEDNFNLKENVIVYDEELTNINNLMEDLPYELEDSSIYIRNKNYLPRIDNYHGDKNVISTNIGINSYISSVYSNVLNSYTVRVLEHLGKKVIGVSIELSKKELDLLIHSYQERYQRIPELMVMVFGHYELMLMKHCFINKAFGYKNKHCGECKKDYKLDKIYPVYGDKYCNLSILSKDCLNLTSFIGELKDSGVKHFLFDFTKVTDIEMSLLYRSNGYYGHYIKRIE